MKLYYCIHATCPSVLIMNTKEKEKKPRWGRNENTKE
jgi:hypothetical protein